MSYSQQQQPSSHDLKNAHKLLFDSGLQTRYAVAGKEYVDKALANGSSDFSRPMQEYVTESCWHSIWGRPGLEKKTRSLLNIAMLCALNRSTELAVHVRGAVNNGATEVEIRETILQVACYCGMPAGIEGTKVAERVILEMKRERGEGAQVEGGQSLNPS
ncbi:4-carboxymuconolactone decarboxylase family protein [Venturia nashicola]|uniref:4-carboxymuconolactone decarboxylase family protein n=1 Tax=Venturia nashicola TaxID=86259 RepID=A0A4Z1NTK7_9PEZI|nr:4-carboxymuconolactone decarboxylase family protein [Venturia nashicola]TLD20109.1 4-carboxymuconolactone decarboxylase family protein [Venturia nashicola]